jgi:hypothetical protein
MFQQANITTITLTKDRAPAARRLGNPRRRRIKSRDTILAARLLENAIALKAALTIRRSFA